MPRVSVLINRPSDSARTIATSLNVKRVRPERLAYLRPRLVINWGVSGGSEYDRRHVWLNHGTKIRNAVNKADAFVCFGINGVSVPRIAMYKQEINWDGITLARTNLTGSGGDGIVVVRPGEELPEAPMYVEYIRKSAEYRVHVVRGEVICVQQKRKREGVEQSRDAGLIRNHANGWVFAVNNVEFSTESVEREIKDQSIAAVAALGLDFGAVDIIVDKAGTKAYVLEVNSAPGLSSPTLIEAYRSAFTRIIYSTANRAGAPSGARNGG